MAAPSSWLGALPLALLALATLLGCGASRPAPGEITVGAASSLRRLMPELVDSFAKETRDARVTVTYGGSGMLRRQVEAGAPIDVVMLAGEEPVDRLIEGGFARAASRRLLALNELVVITPRGGVDVRFESLHLLPAGEWVAVGDPESVPAGRYARDALRQLGTWNALEPRLVHAPHVAAVLALTRRGEAAAGIVYRTDALGLSDVEIRDVARAPWAPVPRVVAAVTRDARDPEGGTALLDWAGGAEGRAIFQRHGFLPAP
jgi:molybdate transport system substrate-binding protein